MPSVVAIRLNPRHRRANGDCEHIPLSVIPVRIHSKKVPVWSLQVSGLRTTSQYPFNWRVSFSLVVMNGESITGVKWYVSCMFHAHR